MPWTFLQIYKDGLPGPTSALAMYNQVQRWRSRNLWQEFYSAIHCISCVARWNKIVATNCDSSIFPLVQTERWSPQESDRQTHVFIIASILCTGMGPMWNWRRKFELICTCGKYFGFIPIKNPFPWLCLLNLSHHAIGYMSLFSAWVILWWLMVFWGV